MTQKKRTTKRELGTRTFPSGVGFDGRYVRALAFKPTINGTWPLLVSATDAVGRKATARCSPGVTVGF